MDNKRNDLIKYSICGCNMCKFNLRCPGYVPIKTDTGIDSCSNYLYKNMREMTARKIKHNFDVPAGSVGLSHTCSNCNDWVDEKAISCRCGVRFTN